MSVRRVCESRGLLFYSIANATSNGVTPETQVTVAERAEKEKLHLEEAKLLEQADLIHWHSQLLEDAERDEIACFPTVRAPRNISRCAHVDLSVTPARKSLQWRSVAYAKGTAPTSTLALPTPWARALLKKDRRRSESVQEKRRMVSALRGCRAKLIV